MSVRKLIESFQSSQVKTGQPSSWSHKHFRSRKPEKKLEKMDITKSEIRDFIRIVFVCICWYIVSSSNGVLGKTILSQFPYPVTVTMVQLTSIAVWSPPLLKVSKNLEFKNTMK